jgi:hypothetical protein
VHANVFSADKEKFIKCGIDLQYLRVRFSGTGISFSLIISVFDTFLWPSTTDVLQKFESSEIKVLVTHFRKMLIADVNSWKILMI